jgi:hypothetical protein
MLCERMLTWCAFPVEIAIEPESRSRSGRHPRTLTERAGMELKPVALMESRRRAAGGATHRVLMFVTKISH